MIDPLATILIWVLADIIIDFIVFKLVKVPHVTAIVDIVLNVLIPSAVFYVAIYAGMTSLQFAQTYAVYVENLVYWLASCFIAMPFTLMIGLVTGIFTGEQPEY